MVYTKHKPEGIILGKEYIGWHIKNNETFKGFVYTVNRNSDEVSLMVEYIDKYEHKRKHIKTVDVISDTTEEMIEYIIKYYTDKIMKTVEECTTLCTGIIDINRITKKIISAKDAGDDEDEEKDDLPF